MATIQSDFRWVLLHIAATSSSSPILSLSSNLMLSRAAAFRRTLPSCSTASFRLRAFSSDVARETAVKIGDKPSICTADELHYVSVPNSDWKLALWRYPPCPKVVTPLFSSSNCLGLFLFNFNYFD